MPVMRPELSLRRISKLLIAVPASDISLLTFLLFLPITGPTVFLVPNHPFLLPGQARIRSERVPNHPAPNPSSSLRSASHAPTIPQALGLPQARPPIEKSFGPRCHRLPWPLA